MSKQEKPCIINVGSLYPEKSVQDIKELEKYISDLQVAKPLRQELRGYIKDYALDKGRELKSKYLNIVDTLGKGVLNIERMADPKWANDPKQAALSFYEETSSVVKGAGISVERIMQVKQKQFFGNFMSKLEATGYREAWSNSIFDREIRAYLREGILPDNASSKAVKEMGDMLRDSYLAMNRELNTSGLAVAYRKDYDGPIVHDGNSIYGKFSEWITSLTNALDYAEEFPILSSDDINEFELMKQAGKIDENSENAVVKILKGSYDNIIRDVGDAPLDNNKFVSISERRSRGKAFTKWKSGEDVHNYLQEFGKYKTLSEQFNYYANSTARDVGLVSVLGASPSKGHAIIMKEAERRLAEKGITGENLKKELQDIDIAYRNIVETRAYNPTIIGKLFMSQRQVAALAKLGWSGTTSFFLDPQSMANQRRIMYGEGLIQSVLSSYGHYFSSIKDAATLKDVEARYLYSQNQLGSTLEELYDLAKNKNFIGLASEMVAKGSGGYFSNKVSHVSSVKMWLKFLADGAKEGKLSKVAMADLEKFGITKGDIDVVSQLEVKDYGMLNVNNLNAMEYAKMSGMDMADLEKVQFELIEFKNRINSWVLERARKSAPIPGNRERRKLYGDTVAGTLEGEGRRFLGQFKATALKQMTDMSVGGLRSLNPDMDQTGFRIGSKKTSAYYVGRLAGGLTMAGLSYMYLGALLRQDEKTLQRFEDGDISLVLEGFARGGGGFILNDMVKMNSNYLYNLGQLASPAVTALVKHPANIGKAIKGEPESAIIDELKTNIPGANLIWLSPFMEGFDDHAKERARLNTQNYLK